MRKKRHSGKSGGPRPKRLCDTGICDRCQYIGEGDFLCDKHMEIVVSDWVPTESYLMCERGNRRE